jgi:hypothetical protein
VALSPNDGETFLKEVDDELRREQFTNFFTRYGWWIVGGIVLVLGAVGGWLWWSGRQVESREGAGETLVAVATQLQSNQSTAAAQPQINSLAASDVEGYRAAALFARAASQQQAGNAAAALGTLRAIGEDQTLDQVYRDAALIRRTQIEYDRLQPQEVIRRLNTMANSDSGWSAAAAELVGVAHLRMNRPDLAGPVFVRISRDEAAPPTLRQRASLMAGSLGFDPDPNAPHATAPAPPAPAAPATQAAPAATPATAPATREKAR